MAFSRAFSENNSMAFSRILSSHHLFHAVEVMCPGDPDSLPDHHLEYYTMLLYLEQLVCPSLLQLCTKNNNITGLSVPHSATICSQTKVLLTSSGDLILSLDKDDSQLLGLDGKKQKDRNYLTVINLMSESFKPGKPKYNKAKECLKRLSSPVNLVICLNTTSSNQEARAQFLSSTKATRCCCESTIITQCSIDVPVIKESLPAGNEPTACSAEEFYHWIGAISCGLNLTESSSDSYSSRCCTPEPYQRCGAVSRRLWRGAINSESVNIVIDMTRKSLSTSALPWAVVTVWGFVESLLNCSEQRDKNMCWSIVLFKNSERVWCFI